MKLVGLSHRIVLSASAAAAAFVAACAGDLGEPSAPAPGPEPELVDVAAPAAAPAGELAPLAAVERANGNLVELYEPAPGQFLFTEIGDGATLMGRYDSVTELFLAAAPGADLPDAVVEAQDRADAMAVVAPRPVVKGESPAPVVIDEAGGGEAGARAVCGSFTCYSSSGTDTSWCKTSWWNGFYWSWTSVNKVYHTMCSRSGTFTAKLLIDSVNVVQKTVSTGQQYTIGYIAQPSLFSSNDFNFYTEITSAQGDNFATTGFAIDL